MPTGKEYFLVAAAAFLPVLFAYLGVKSAFRLAVGSRRGDLAELLARERGSFLAIGAANTLCASLSIEIEGGSSYRTAERVFFVGMGGDGSYLPARSEQVTSNVLSDVT